MRSPLTTRIRRLPTMVRLIPRTDRVPDESVVNLDAMQLIRTTWLDGYVTRLTPSRMEEVERAIRFALDLKC